MREWLSIVREAATATAPFVLRMTPLEFALLMLGIAQFLLALSAASARIAGLRPGGGASWGAPILENGFPARGEAA